MGIRDGVAPHLGRYIESGKGQGESFLGRKWLIGKKIKKELDKPEGISHAKMV